MSRRPALRASLPALLLGSGLALMSSAAQAQQNTGAKLPDASPNALVKPTVRADDGARGKTVLERKRPDYDPIGFPVGAFTLKPAATISAGFTTNVFSEQDGEEDVIGRLILEATADSNWSRHDLKVTAAAASKGYAEFTDANVTTYNIAAAGRFDIDARTAVTAAAGTGRFATDRDAVEEVVVTEEPVIYQRTFGSLGAKGEWGRVNASILGEIIKSDYEDATTRAGLPLNQQYRDYTLRQLGVDVSYDMGGGRRIFVAATTHEREYRLQTPSLINRDEQGYEIITGIRSEITPLLRGQLGVGYIHADFDDPTIASRGEVSVDAKLDYLVTELTTIRFEGKRYLQNAQLANAAASLNTRFLLGADHELYRNVILSADLVYEDGDPIGVDGSSEKKYLDLRATWLINRHYRLGANLRTSDRHGDRAGLSREVDETQGNISFTYRP